MQYYNLKKILSKNAHYNIIFGERSNGKTYACLEYALKEYIETGNQFAYLRRMKEDIVGKRASTIFNALIENNVVGKLTKGEYTTIYYNGGCYYLANYDEELNKVIPNANMCIGYIFSLTDMEHNKSTSYPKVTTIIFDEFLTRQYYLTDEFILFMNTISTIVRQRVNVKIFMLGNTVNKYCPYFKELGLKHIEKMKQGDIDIYTYGESDLRVAVEYATSTSKKEKKSNLYFAFDNPKLNMIKSGSWEVALYPHNPYKYTKKDVVLTYFIIFEGNTLQCEIVQNDNVFFTYIHEKTTPIKDEDNDIVYTLDYSPKYNYSRNILRPVTKMQRKIAWFFTTDNVFYQDNEVGEIVRNYLQACQRRTIV